MLAKDMLAVCVHIANCHMINNHISYKIFEYFAHNACKTEWSEISRIGSSAFKKKVMQLYLLLSIQLEHILIQ